MLVSSLINITTPQTVIATLTVNKTTIRQTWPNPAQLSGLSYRLQHFMYLKSPQQHRIGNSLSQKPWIEIAIATTKLTARQINSMNSQKCHVSIKSFSSSVQVRFRSVSSKHALISGLNQTCAMKTPTASSVKMIGNDQITFQQKPNFELTRSRVLFSAKFAFFSDEFLLTLPQSPDSVVL